MKIIDAVKMAGIYNLYLEITKEIDPEDLKKYISIEKIEKGSNIVYDGSKYKGEGSIYGVVSGLAKLTYYPGKNHEYTVVFSQGQWASISSAISGIIIYSDVEFLTDTVLLRFSLGRVIRERPDIMKYLWPDVTKIMVGKYTRLLQHTMKLASMSNEFLFLKYLADSDYNFDGIPTRELSEMTDINLRTLQRIIKNLENEGIIMRDKRKNNIWVEDKKKFYEYMDDLEK